MNIPLLILITCYLISVLVLASLDERNERWRATILAAMWPVLAVAILLLLTSIGLMGLATCAINPNKEPTK